MLNINNNGGIGMEIKEYVDIANTVLRWLSIFVIPLFGIIISKLVDRNNIMNPNKERLGRLFKNTLRFIGLVILLDILMFLSISEVFVSVKSINSIKSNLLSGFYIFTAFNVMYAMFLLPLFIKEKKYYEVELTHNNQKRKYIVHDRIKDKDDGKLIYVDEHENKEYEENISDIKKREGRVTFIPHAVALFSLNKDAIKETKVFPMRLRWTLFIILAAMDIYIGNTCLKILYDLWRWDFGTPLIPFRIFVSTFPVLVLTEITILVVFLYRTWLGKNKLEYNKGKKVDSKMTISEKKAFRMISLFKGEFRSVKDKTSNIMKNDYLNYQQKRQQLDNIENECVENVLRYPEIDKDFIYDLKNLLVSYKVGANGREQAYRNFIGGYVNGNIEELVQFMTQELLGEYEHAIRRHRAFIETFMEDDE
ncbi:hypothetical protein [Staphylococcus warneri]|uniref:hypothetical protein n=3 Tax=Staphylococcus warneri TaxID=1292 RepID=UPI0025A30DE1|nr:hypothetical protein [Staphylococcus warneri]